PWSFHTVRTPPLRTRGCPPLSSSSDPPTHCAEVREPRPDIVELGAGRPQRLVPTTRVDDIGVGLLGLGTPKRSTHRAYPAQMVTFNEPSVHQLDGRHGDVVIE